jgi:hypothetical protein
VIVLVHIVTLYALAVDSEPGIRTVAPCAGSALYLLARVALAWRLAHTLDRAVSRPASPSRWSIR